MVKNRISCTPGIHTGAFTFHYNTLDLFFEQKNVNFAAYADDNTLYFFDKNLEVILEISFRYVH